MTDLFIGQAKVETFRRDFRTSARRYRMFNRETNKFLHMSGNGEVAGTDYAWSGTVEQARKLKKQAERWPYRGVRA